MKKIVLALSCLLLVSSCKADDNQRQKPENQISRIYGHWKCVREGLPVKGHETVILTEKEMNIITSSAMVIYELKDGLISIRRAGTDHIIAVVNVIDNDTFTFVTTKMAMCENGKFVRSNTDEIKELRQYKPTM